MKLVDALNIFSRCNDISYMTAKLGISIHLRRRTDKIGKFFTFITPVPIKDPEIVYKDTCRYPRTRELIWFIDEMIKKEEDGESLSRLCLDGITL